VSRSSAGGAHSAAGGDEAGRERYASQALFTGCVALIAYPRAAIAKFLIEGLALLPERPLAEGLHPVLFIFGRVAEGSLLVGGAPVPSRFEYEELMIAVPFVHLGSRRESSIWSATMVCTSPWATWSGNLFYALSKRKGSLRWRGQRFVASDHQGGDLLRASVEPAGRPLADPAALVRSAESPLGFATSLPVCGRRENGAWVFSRFRWDLEKARVFPASVTIEAVDSSLGLDGTPRPGEPGSSFWIEGMRWRISPPIEPLA
jgi:hypothetical protein